MARIENAMVLDGHWWTDDWDAQMDRLEAADERMEAARVQAAIEDEELSDAIDANIERMDKLDDELKRVTRILNGEEVEDASSD